MFEGILGLVAADCHHCWWVGVDQGVGKMNWMQEPWPKPCLQ